MLLEGSQLMELSYNLSRKHSGPLCALQDPVGWPHAPFRRGEARLSESVFIVVLQFAHGAVSSGRICTSVVLQHGLGP